MICGKLNSHGLVKRVKNMEVDWKIGRWKTSGLILFEMKLNKGWNLVVRLVPPMWDGAVLLEDREVTDGLVYLGFDVRT